MSAGKRELSIRIRFTTPCLGNYRSRKSVRVKGKRRQRTYYKLPRGGSGKVVFMSTWWQSILRKSADVLCRHQKAVKEIHFSPEVDGSPKPIPENFYRRYYKQTEWTAHEAFASGDVIGVSAIVPNDISDDDFRRLLDIGGKYYGISPFGPGEYGFFEVDRLERRGPEPEIKPSVADQETEQPDISTKREPSSL